MVSTHSKWTDSSALQEKRKHFGYVIHDVARQLRRHFDAEAQRHELTMPQWRVIAQLSLADGVSQVALSSLCETDPMTISGVVERLEAKGLVERQPDPADSRAKIVLITPKARAVVAKMKLLADEVYSTAFQGISDADRETTLRVLNQMSANLSGQRTTSKEELV
ncbi:MAG TPA: MarR family winged helix-turn-helix transcriptional regulator [Devosiaceae bacterium]|jgi:DNA-binding MarR family transcriptional regulator|nr:MarR family winged helix-turn-helix transcriptional regulator [Devosiaceae bacterium]